MTRYAHLISNIRSWDLRNRSVFLRADLNTDLDAKTLGSDLKYTRLRPTLNLLLERGAHVHLATHRGSPQHYGPELSTAPLALWLKEQGYPIGTNKVGTNGVGTNVVGAQITVLENVRFNPEEHDQSIGFACSLAQSMDFYVNDAFGSIHRSDTSLVTMPQLFPREQRGIGLLIEQEIKHLTTFFSPPTQPAILIVGGGKGVDKLSLVAALMPLVTTILLCPGLSSFLLFPDQQHPADVQKAIELLQQGVSTGTVLLPIDYLVCKQGAVWQPPFRIVPTGDVTTKDMLISIGPATSAAWKKIINESKTIIYNGPMGSLTIPETTHYTRELLTAIANSTASSIVGGGDSLQALAHFKLANRITYCSTGGGALLTFLSDATLPALQALSDPYNPLLCSP